MVKTIIGDFPRKVGLNSSLGDTLEIQSAYRTVCTRVDVGTTGFQIHNIESGALVYWQYVSSTCCGIEGDVVRWRGLAITTDEDEIHKINAVVVRETTSR